LTRTKRYSAVPEHRYDLLVETPLLEVYDVTCLAHRSGLGGRHTARAPLGVSNGDRESPAVLRLPLRGVLGIEWRGQTVAMDTSTAMFIGVDEEYRINHLVPGQEKAILIILAASLCEDVFGNVEGGVASLRSHDHLGICLAAQALRDDGDRLEAEELTMTLLGSISPRFTRDPGRTLRRLRPAQLSRIEDVRALLAASPTTRWDLHSIGRTVHCSPFHLSRQFRAVTGETVSRYLLRLRLAEAVGRLANGERDLAVTAVESGFAHHSHFSRRFRAAFGVTPRQARGMLTRHRLQDLRAALGNS